LIFLLVFSIAFCLVLGGVYPSLNSPAEALTSTTVNSAYKAGDGEELWDSASSSFNGLVLNDITQKLFGDQDAVEYIKANGADTAVISMMNERNKEMDKVINQLNAGNVITNNKNIQPNINNEFNITMPNVTNSTAAETLMRDLQSLRIKKYQMFD